MSGNGAWAAPMRAASAGAKYLAHTASGRTRDAS